jgi:hypothetical protein
MRWSLVFLVACGGGDDKPIDAPKQADAYDTARCLITGIYGDLGAKTGTTSQGPTTLTVVLDAGPPRDSFFLKLNGGKGVFTGGLANGTYTIAGAELAQSTCGLCVNIVADISTMGPAKFYFATGGQVTLTNTNPPTGSLANVTFKEVDATGNAVPNGCAASMTTMQFSP